MPLIEPLDEDALDADLREAFGFFRTTLGGIPNSIRTMARRPAIARAYLELNMAVMEDYGAVTPEFKRLLGYVASFASGCLYCQAHMILASERFNAGAERLDAVFDFESAACFSEAEKAALAFAHAAAAVPNVVDDGVGARLREHWDDDAVVEIMAVVSLFGWLNRWNDSMGTALEDLPLSRGEQRLRGATGWTPGKHGS